MSIEEIRKQVLARVAEEGVKPKTEQPVVIDRPFIQKCLSANELGDATLYIALNRGRRLYNRTTGEWMKWAGHHWEIDKNESDAMAAMEMVVNKYREEAKAIVDEISEEKNQEIRKKLIEKQKAIYRRIDRLRSVRGTNNALTYTLRCEDRLIVDQEDFDKDPWALPVKNGVVDLKTGELRPGNPKDLQSKFCVHEWIGIDAEAPIWEQAVFDIMNGDVEMVAFLNRLFGYAITGLVNERILPVFWGTGNNGKSMLVETVKYVLGEMAAPIRAEMLLDQSFMKSSSGPTPDIMGLKGLRVAFANETDAGRRISSSQVKLLTGGDSLVGRSPHDKYETKFFPTHTIFLLTNNKPTVPYHEEAVWRRLRMVPFQVSFVDTVTEPNQRIIDKDLPEKLKAEASGILAWLVRGCLLWQRQGLDCPELVLESTFEYRKENDKTADFIDECCIKGDQYRVKSTELYNAFTEWWIDNRGRKDTVPSHTAFGKIIGQKFKKKKDIFHYYHGIALLENPQTGR